MMNQAATDLSKELNADVSVFTDKVGIVVSPAETTDPMQLDTEAVKDLVREHGAVVFSGFGFDVETFEAFSSLFSDDFMNNQGSGSWRKTMNPKSDGTIQNVAYTYGIGHQRTFPLPLHADRAYVKSRPELMFFMSGKPAAENGETTICDGFRVYEALSDSTRELLESTRIKYVRNYADGEWQTLYHTQNIEDVRAYCEKNDMALVHNDDNSIHTEFVQSAVPLTKWQRKKSFCNSVQIGYWQEHGLGRRTTFVRLEDDREIPAEIMAEIDEVSENMTANIPWKAGDIAIVDNTRMLHGRRAFEDEERAIYTRMCRSVTW